MHGIKDIVVKRQHPASPRTMEIGKSCSFSRRMVEIHSPTFVRNGLAQKHAKSIPKQPCVDPQSHYHTKDPKPATFCCEMPIMTEEKLGKRGKSVTEREMDSSRELRFLKRSAHYASATQNIWDLSRRATIRHQLFGVAVLWHGTIPYCSSCTKGRPSPLDKLPNLFTIKRGM